MAAIKCTTSQASTSIAFTPSGAALDLYRSCAASAYLLMKNLESALDGFRLIVEKLKSKLSSFRIYQPPESLYFNFQGIIKLTISV